MKTKHFLIAAMAMLASVAITGCKSTKSVQSNSNEVTVPLSGKEYRTDKDYFRTSQSGKSPDLATAKKIALHNAKAELAGNIRSFIKAVAENYTNQRTVADQQEFENKFEEMPTLIVNQTLNDVKVIGEQIFKENDGKYTYYIAIEMSKESVVNNVADRISKDAKLQLDFDKHLYRKISDETMQKFEEQQQ